MIIYKWYEDKVESREVVKETNKLFYIEDGGWAFNFKRQLYKDAVNLTESEAVDERYKNLEEQRDKLVKKLRDVEDELELVKSWPTF